MQFLFDEDPLVLIGGNNNLEDGDVDIEAEDEDDGDDDDDDDDDEIDEEAPPQKYRRLTRDTRSSRN